MSSGVLGADYAISRQRSPAVSYRYRARAKVARELAEKYIPFRGYYEVLEMGCAEGRTLLEIRRLFGGRGRFVGLEASAELLASAPELPTDVTLVQGDVCEPPETIKPESFDLVCALALLEHLPEPYRAAEVAARLLKPGGVFVATCPNPFWDEVAGRLGLLDGDAHVSEMDEHSMLKVASIVGEPEYVPFMSVALGSLPYLRIPVSVDWSARYDSLLRTLPPTLVKHLFVNQAVVARKPK